MTIYTEESLYALSLDELKQLCEEREVTPLASNPRWKKSYVPALLAAQAKSGLQESQIEEEPAPVSASETEAVVTACPWTEEETLPPVPVEEEGVVEPQSSPASLIYPIVFFLFAAWVVLQAAVGVLCLVVAGLRLIANKVDVQAITRLESLRSPSSSSVELATV